MVAPNSPLSHTCGACREACCAARADGMGIAPLSVECHIKDPVPNMSEGSFTPIPSPRMFGGVYGQCIRHGMTRRKSYKMWALPLSTTEWSWMGLHFDLTGPLRGRDHQR